LGAGARARWRAAEDDADQGAAASDDFEEQAVARRVGEAGLDADRARVVADQLVGSEVGDINEAIGGIGDQA